MWPPRFTQRNILGSLYTSESPDETRLRNLETFACQSAWNVEAPRTPRNVDDEIRALKLRLGKRWDAVDRIWRTLTEDQRADLA